VLQAVGACGEVGGDQVAAERRNVVRAPWWCHDGFEAATGVHHGVVSAPVLVLCRGHVGATVLQAAGACSEVGGGHVVAERRSAARAPQ